jgi:hypothetical protein
LTIKQTTFGPASAGLFCAPKNKFKKKVKKKVAKQKNALSLWGHKAQDDQHIFT